MTFLKFMLWSDTQKHFRVLLLRTQKYIIQITCIQIAVDITKWHYYFCLFSYQQIQSSSWCWEHIQEGLMIWMEMVNFVLIKRCKVNGGFDVIKKGLLDCVHLAKWGQHFALQHFAVKNNEKKCKLTPTNA